MSDSDDLDSSIQKILSGKKYREMNIPQETVRDLLSRELASGEKPKEALKLAKRKLHNIVASYLGDPDYGQEMHNIDTLFAAVPTIVEEKAYCQKLLETHASSRERMPYLDEFYPVIFSITGKPSIILDLACALHPFSLPWMELPVTIRYHAYDIHQPRLELINHYFSLRGMQPLAENRDILIAPPDFECDVIFIFKEMHRMEKRERGSSRRLWQELKCQWLVVTLPAVSLTGEHNLRQYHRQMVLDTIEGWNWSLVECELGNEMIFCLKTGH